MAKKQAALRLAIVYTIGTDPLVFAPPAYAGIAAELASCKPELPSYEPKVAEELLTRYRPRLAAIPPDRLDVPRVDVESVARALLAVYAVTQLPPVLAAYEAAGSAKLFLVENLEHLRALSLVLLHVYLRAESVGALRTNAKVPATLDAESLAVEKRMQTVCEHFLGNHPEAGPVLRQLSPGTGFLDRAYDLFGYADVYEQYHGIVSTDPVHFVKTDVADARRLASQILSVVGAAMTPQAREAFDVLRRTWTLVKPLYTEVQEIGLAALRYDPERGERFPSLYAVGRKGQGRRKGAKEAAVPEVAVEGAAASAPPGGVTAPIPPAK